MAVGDVVSDVFDLAAATFAQLQPAAAVSLLITNFSAEEPTNAFYYMFDGTFYPTTIGAWDGAAIIPTPKLFLTNTNYLRMYNNSGATRSFAYTGIQIQ